ncbi:MAG: tetratricopeptide repeat-containing sulfotransferase family protein [Rhodanobacteraceae bacterium]
MAMVTPPADAQFALAQSLWQRNEVDRCEATLRELLTRRPGREDATLLLAELLRSQGRLDAASQAMFEFCRKRDFEPATSIRAARFIQECHRHVLAAEVCDAAIARGGNDPALLSLAGNIVRELGEFGKARSLYLAALDRGVDLNTHFVLGALAHTQRYVEADHPDFGRFSAHFGNEAFTARSRASAGFALAKAHDDTHDPSSAATVLRGSNALVREALPWQPLGWEQFASARKLERVARARVEAAEDFVPVFIVGLPRSGTTLTAAQLARHTSARDRGELRLLRFIAERLIGEGLLGDVQAVGEAAQLYRAHARQDDEPATWYLDQDPLNFRYLHVAAAMFPQARVIVCRRNLRDTALSLWSQDFAHSDCAFAYDFASIAHYAAGYDDLIRHWQRTLHVPIHVVEYESLVADPHGVLEDLREFVGAHRVDTDVAAGPAPINSSSVWQARQPIYSTSIGRWRGYLPYVPELERFPE